MVSDRVRVLAFKTHLTENYGIFNHLDYSYLSVQESYSQTVNVLSIKKPPIQVSRGTFGTAFFDMKGVLTQDFIFD